MVIFHAVLGGEKIRLAMSSLRWSYKGPKREGRRQGGSPWDLCETTTSCYFVKKTIISHICSLTRLKAQRVGGVGGRTTAEPTTFESPSLTVRLKRQFSPARRRTTTLTTITPTDHHHHHYDDDHVPQTSKMGPCLGEVFR